MRAINPPLPLNLVVADFGAIYGLAWAITHPEKVRIGQIYDLSMARRSVGRMILRFYLSITPRDFVSLTDSSEGLFCRNSRSSFLAGLQICRPWLHPGVHLGTTTWCLIKV